MILRNQLFQGHRKQRPLPPSIPFDESHPSPQPHLAIDAALPASSFVTASVFKGWVTRRLAALREGTTFSRRYQLGATLKRAANLSFPKRLLWYCPSSEPEASHDQTSRKSA